MKTTVFWTIFLYLIVAHLMAGSATAQATEAVTDEEYEIYSAFIDQVYLAEFQNDWFTLLGDKFQTFSHLTKIEEVLIHPSMIPGTTNGYRRFAEMQSILQVPKNLFERFLSRNRDFNRLTNKFSVKAKHRLFPQEEMNALSKEAEKRKVPYEEIFIERNPKAAGVVSFFRAGFDESGSNALFAVTIWNSQRQNAVPSKLGGDHLVLLSKKTGTWKVEKVFPGNPGRSVDLGKCAPTTMHLSLALGSTSCRIIGPKDGLCHVEGSTEIEGGYSRVDCLVPSSVGQLTVLKGEPFLFSKNLSTYCQKPRVGNIFLDLITKTKKP